MRSHYEFNKETTFQKVVIVAATILTFAAIGIMLALGV